MPPKIRPDVTVQQVGEESLVLDLKSDQIHQLNATAAWILARCDGETSIEAISRDFAEVFSLDDATASSDIAATLGQLHRLNVIDLD
jgi:hypothetical protein